MEGARQSHVLDLSVALYSVDHPATPPPLLFINNFSSLLQTLLVTHALRQPRPSDGGKEHLMLVHGAQTSRSLMPVQFRHFGWSRFGCRLSSAPANGMVNRHGRASPPPASGDDIAGTIYYRRTGLAACLTSSFPTLNPAEKKI